MAFDWHRAIELNHEALLGVVSHLLAVLLQRQQEGPLVMANWRIHLCARDEIVGDATEQKGLKLFAGFHRFGAHIKSHPLQTG